MGYKFNTQEEGVEFLKRLGFDVSLDSHIYIAQPKDLPRHISFVASNGEMCLVDEGASELKKYHDTIKENLPK
jgi:hypothetical protein